MFLNVRSFPIYYGFCKKEKRIIKVYKDEDKDIMHYTFFEVTDKIGVFPRFDIKDFEWIVPEKQYKLKLIKEKKE